MVTSMRGGREVEEAMTFPRKRLIGLSSAGAGRVWSAPGSLRRVASPAEFLDERVAVLALDLDDPVTHRSA